MALAEEPELIPAEGTHPGALRRGSFIQVPSDSGGTFTLKYKGRFLYSKYNPTKNIIAAVESLELAPKTLVLAFSPALLYGFAELLKKCKEADCQILCVEADPALHAFCQKTIQAQKSAAALLPLDKNSPRGLDDWFNAARIKCRRVVRLDFSAGVALNADFYNNFFECAQNIVAAFWKNRLTLVRLGRLYCKNIFKNMEAAAACPPFKAFERTVAKPILLCGAGESLDELTRQNCLQDKNCAEPGSVCKPETEPQTGIDGKTKTGLQCKKTLQAQDAAARINKNFFVLAVDAALPALTAAGIKIDAAVATESQLAIEKAWIGLGANGAQTENESKTKTTAGGRFPQDLNGAPSKPILFFDLTSRAAIARRFARGGNCLQDKNCAATACFYFSEFDKNEWTRRLSQSGLLPELAPPLGSVGLTAAYLALRLRKDEGVPIYVLGLDFSFSAGRTHAQGTAQSKTLFLEANRLRPAQNFAAAYGQTGQKIVQKNGAAAWSSKNLLGYAALFRQFFFGAKNLYDAGATGVDLGLPKARLWDVCAALDARPKSEAAPTDFNLANNSSAGNAGAPTDSSFPSNSNRVQNARGYLRGELCALRALADLLSNGEAAQSRDKTITLDEQITRALTGREYLYLHFPDGTEPSLERSFLTRVRSQIDFFAKDIETALAAAQS